MNQYLKNTLFLCIFLIGFYGVLMTIESYISSSMGAPVSISSDPGLWKAYVNKEFGYSVLHPSDWIIEEEENPATSSVKSSIRLSDKTGHNFIVIKVDSKEWLLGSESAGEQKTRIDAGIQTVYFFPDGYKCQSSSEDCSFFTIPIKHKNFWYELNAEKEAKTYSGIYADILSSFRFIDSK